MPAFIKDDDDFYHLFERLARQELRAVAGNAHHRPAIVSALSDAPGAHFIRFFPPEFSPHPVQVGLLPLVAGESPHAEAFQRAYQRPDRFVEITAPEERLGVLEELLNVMRGKQEALHEFMVPTATLKNSTPTPVATLDAYWKEMAEPPSAAPSSRNASVEPAPAPLDTPPEDTHLVIEEETVDNQPGSFWALANEILAEEPAPGVYGFESFESYRVWAHRKDPKATLVVRYFDGARAWAIGAVIDCDQDQNVELNGGIAYLTETRGDLITTRADDSAWHYQFEQLRGSAARERLATVLAAYAEQGGLVFQTGACGAPSANTLAHLAQLQRTYHRVEHTDTHSEALTPFQVFANLYLDDDVGDAEVIWTVERERAQLERIEILEHRAHPNALLILHFDPAANTVCACAYAPPDTAKATAKTFFRAASLLLSARQIQGSRALPLPYSSDFVRVPRSSAVAQLEAALDAIDEASGTVFEIPCGKSVPQAANRA
jgi:hypothetical protein